MGIPESQLETWSHQGSITQSAATYQTIRSALDTSNAGYSSQNYTIFLQGSYGNDTNIYAESDVDVVIQFDDVYYSDLSDLTPEDKVAYEAEFTPATYSYSQFKKDVLKALTDRFGADVKAGDKAISIAASGNRRKADVIAAMEFRRYSQFRSWNNSTYTKGICFFDSTGVRIANYPKQHSANLTIAHQNRNTWLKPMIRVLKNLRSKMVADGVLEAGVAPSYYLEGLLYNVPISKFGGSYRDCFINAFNWLQEEANKSELVCANEQYYLLRNGHPVCWEIAKGELFIYTAIKTWNEW